MSVKILQGDCRDMLKTLPNESVDAVVTDPPYGLRFMGKHWDYEVPSVEVWRECLRVLRPGGHLLSFAGTRTHHRMAVNIEDAGFEIRDMIAWVYGSGFPKSLNVSKAIESGGGRPEDIRRMQQGAGYQPSGRGRVNYDHGAASAMDAGPSDWQPTTDAARQWQGWGTALKPALEPITVARKPLDGTVAENVQVHGPGALNIDGCRVPAGESTRRARTDNDFGVINDDGWHAKPGENGSDTGRWPANLIHDGSDDVVAHFPESKGQQGDVRGTEQSGVTNGIYGEFNGRVASPARNDTGSAARFFYCAKASKSERGEGNNHPTVKPLELMRYLCRLVTPAGGLVLDPFMGSGTTALAAMAEGFSFVGIEREAQYVEIAKRRIEGDAPLFAEVTHG